MRAYIVEGFLYSEGWPAGAVLVYQDNGNTYGNFREEPLGPTCRVKRYTALDGGQPCLLEDGDYHVISPGERVELLTVAKKRVPVNVCTNGKPMPFADDVYPVLYGAVDAVSASFKQGTEGSGSWPKILVDGNEEVFSNGEKRSYTYSKIPREGDPFVLRGGIAASLKGKRPLQHGDILSIGMDGETVQTFRWDQISKVWYVKKDPEEYPMVNIKGGTYTMGDYRGKLYHTSFGSYNANMKKKWLHIHDPQFMGESAVGADALGVGGLRDEDSSAKDPRADYWCFNEDALALHDVEVSDFEMGKYQVTMEQFYGFVSALSGETEESLFYEIEGERFGIHEIAGIGLFAKMKHIRDNGWGLGDRPVINVCFHEIVEFCNYLSRKRGFEPCYRIRPVFAGSYDEGKSEANVVRYRGDSCMQVYSSMGELHQLVEITCDREKNGYRLPTEAEFEYAIRGGEWMKETPGGKGDRYAGITVDGTRYNCDTSWQRLNTDNPRKDGLDTDTTQVLDDNFGGNGYTSPVGTKIPNRLGLYDLSGNVWETMNDYFSRSYYEQCAREGIVKNPMGPVYSPEQLSDMKKINVDPYYKGCYMYYYEDQPDGTKLRKRAMSMEAVGKTVHVFRGGCFSNPLAFTSALYRHTVGGAENSLNYFKARTGFRLARSTEKENEQ